MPRGHTLFECLWSIVLASIVLYGALSFCTNISQFTFRLIQKQNGDLAALKTSSIISAALRALELSRLDFAATVTPGDRLTLANGGSHPLVNMRGTTAPRSDSHILSIISLAPRYRGRVLNVHAIQDSFEADICDLLSVPRTGEFRSFVILTVGGARQLVGDLSQLNSHCAHLTGTLIRGLISQELDILGTPLVFVPIEREYSLFVDRTGNFRLASHVGMRITENQPLLRGLQFIRVNRLNATAGASIFSIDVKPTPNALFSAVFVPGLTQREIWSEILP